jgi:hypothetical protein
MKMTDGQTVMEVEAQTLRLRSQALKLAGTISQWANQLPVKTAPPVKPEGVRVRVRNRRPAASSDAVEAEAAAAD